MQSDARRITLVTCNPSRSGRDWDLSNPIGSRLIFVKSARFLPFALHRGINELGQDVDRVIVDQTGTAEQYLELLASLPEEFLGDVLYVRADGQGYLSSVGRGGNRVMYSLTASNVEFYLQTNSLVWTAPAVQACA